MIDSLIGPAFGLLTAVFFAGGSILVRIGQRDRPDDDGVFMTVLVNVVVLFVATLFVEPPEWNQQGIIALVVGGIIGTVLGRTFLLRTVRLLGPSRASGFVVGTPVVAAIGGWIVLGESITIIEGVGGAITLIGFWLLAKALSTGNITDEKPPVWYYLVAVGAPLFFGTAFVFRKYGLNLYPDSYRGAFIGAASAFPLIVLIDLLRGQLGERIRSNFSQINWWFVTGGVASGRRLASAKSTAFWVSAWPGRGRADPGGHQGTPGHGVAEAVPSS